VTFSAESYTHGQPSFWEQDPPAPGIFLNYRYVDIMSAVALDTMLIPRYGARSIFRADRSLQPGDLYKTIIPQAAARASLMLVIIGHNWGQSLAEGRHRWALTELHEAKNANTPMLPVCLRRTLNDHASDMRWNPVEVPAEMISANSLPECIPDCLLDNNPVFFGTQQPSEDTAAITKVIETIAPELALVANS